MIFFQNGQCASDVLAKEIKKGAVKLRAVVIYGGKVLRRYAIGVCTRPQLYIQLVYKATYSILAHFEPKKYTLNYIFSLFCADTTM